jgi:uncharacterized protein YcbK (DUF882 family)
MAARALRLSQCLAFAAALTSAVAYAQPRPRKVALRPAPPNYTQAMIGLHAPTPGKTAPLDAHGRPMLVLASVNRQERVEIPVLSEKGGFSTRDLERAAHALRSGGGDEHPIDPRVLDIVYKLQTHFGAQEIRVVSGYRVPTGRGTSNHGRGRAIDLIVPGTPDIEVAKFAREIGFVGVGIYPTSQFVHVDVRPRSYFWVDYSGPGRRNREKGILGDLAAWSDQRAAARGDKPVEPFVIGADVDAAIRARAAQTKDAHAHDEEEDDESGG